MKVVVHYGSGTDSGEDVYLGGKCRTDFGDIRFTDNDGQTLLDYWIESKADSDNAVIWVKVADDLSSADVPIYIYYGNASATSISNIDTYLLGDDFLGTVLDTNKWEASAGLTYSVSDSKLHVTGCPEDKWGTLFGFKALQGGVTFNPPDNSYLIELKDIYWNDGDSSSPLYKWGIILSNGTDYALPISEFIDDAWAANTGQKEAHIESNSYASGQGTLPHSGTAQFKLQVDQNSNAEIFWNGTSILGPYSSTTAIAQLWLLVNRYSTDPFAQEVSIDRILMRKYVSPEPTHGAWGNEEVLGNSVFFGINL